ncbi:MAG: hypothetical protein GTO17_09455 [Candidatus Aminicenantes bacterium]|nr:hypothetical protein [Candidatus Aminicenantes bacterium]
MKKILMVLVAFSFTSYFHQIHTFDEVWQASIKTVDEIGFKIENLDRNAGFIGAENGCLGCPLRLLIMVTEFKGRVYMDYKVLQKKPENDPSEEDKETIRKFIMAMNRNLNP